MKYTLTHSKYGLLAATVTDGVDAGYFQYVAFLNSRKGMIQNFEQLNGGPPFGSNLQAWTETSPGFNLDKVKTPLRITALSKEALLGEWEWFAALTRLRKPVEFVALQDGAHILVRPWDRMVSQGGTVDWFRFWLKGEEDTDPAKAEQYERWRELKKMQEKNDAKDRGKAAAN